MKYIIIGAGAAGITAAKTIRVKDTTAEITIISTDKHIHSRCMIHHYLSHERDEYTLNFVPENFIEEEHIQWISDTKVVSIDPAKKEIRVGSGYAYIYDKLLIATGADSVIPPIGDFKTAKNVFGLRNLSDAQCIDEMIQPDITKVLIVGSGLVGLDAAYALLKRNCEVTIVEMADRILPVQLDKIAGQVYQDKFEGAGCQFILGRRASETTNDEDGNVRIVTLDDGTEIDCDVVIVAAGVRPALDCIKGSGIKAERFIEVNGFMETSEKDIFAAGDVAGLSGIWPNAMKQGQVAANNMLGDPTYYVDQYAMKNTINFFGVTTLSIGKGLEEEGDKVLVREDKFSYKKAILKNDKLISIVLQGKIDYSGIYQYLIKNEVDLKGLERKIFNLSFADFYSVLEDGHYDYQIEA